MKRLLLYRTSFVRLTFAALVTILFAHSALADGKLKVAAIYTVPVEQQWVGRINHALGLAKDRGEIAYSFSENVANADYERVMRQYAEAGNQLIIGEAFAVETAARKVARDYPGVAFLMGSSAKPVAPNFSVFDNYIQESSYLSGLIAGGMTKTNVIGMVGGFPIPEVNRLMHAFMLGAKESNPKATFLVTFIGSWFDPPKAKEAAYAQIDRGADVLYAERFGVSDAAKDRGRLAIGNVIDTQPEFPDTVVASALWFMEPTIDHAIQAVKASAFKAENYGPYSTMKFHGNALAPLGKFEGKIPAAVLALVKKREEAILSGKFSVPVVETDPKSTK